MKNYIKLITLLLIILLIAGDYNTQIQAQTGNWNIALKTKIEHAVNIAGFFNNSMSMGITVGNFGEAHYTNDKGQTWSSAVNNSSCLFGLDILDEKNAWTCGNLGYIGYSKDSGQTWQGLVKFGLAEPDHCRYISFIDLKTGWVASPFEVAITKDGGQSWTVINLPLEIARIAAIALQTASDGYVIDENDKLYLTKDGGKTWRYQKLKFTDEPFDYAIYYSPTMAIRFTDSEHGIIVSNRKGKIMALVTSDGGLSWKEEFVAAVSGSLFLSRDGKMLTVVNFAGTTITVLRKD